MVCTLSYAPAKTNENAAFKLLNESIYTDSGNRKVGPAGYTWVSNVIVATIDYIRTYLRRYIIYDMMYHPPPPEWLSILENYSSYVQLLHKSRH